MDLDNLLPITKTEYLYFFSNRLNLSSLNYLRILGVQIHNGVSMSMKLPASLKAFPTIAK